MSIYYTIKEEKWNTWSHAAGIFLSVAVGIYFLCVCIEAHNLWATTGVSLYLMGMLGCYISSTLYHATPKSNHRTKEILRRWDHSAIYWHIAGSYSPFALTVLREQSYWGWSLFIFVWLCAIVGTYMSFTRLKEHSNVETICFIAMGLSILVVFKPLIETVGCTIVGWMIAEGVCYITGAGFYSRKDCRYMHTVFHFFVLGGSICHIIAVWYLLLQL